MTENQGGLTQREPWRYFIERNAFGTTRQAAKTNAK